MGCYSKITINKRCNRAEFLFGGHIVLVSQLNIAALCSLATHEFLCNYYIVFSPMCLCSYFSFISHEVFLAKDSSEHLGLMLGSSDDVTRLWSWGPGLKVHHGAHLPCSGESATYWVIGPDPAHAMVKPVNISDSCQSKPWWSMEILVFSSKVHSRGMRFFGRSTSRSGISPVEKAQCALSTYMWSLQSMNGKPLGK